MTIDRAIRSVLTHPLVMRVKPALRDCWWTVRAAGERNPPLPPVVRSLVFVCLGNICRSPFAARLAAQQLARAGQPDLVCTSAGLRPSASGVPPEAHLAAAQHGISLAGHVPQPLTREMLAAHDMVLVMEHGQLTLLRQQFPEFRDRLFLFPLFDAAARGVERFHVADPFGTEQMVYESCYLRIARVLTACLAAVSSRAAAAPGRGEKRRPSPALQC